MDILLFCQMQISAKLRAQLLSMKNYKYLVLALTAFLASCQDGSQKEKPVVAADAPLFSLLDPVESGVDFTNTSIETVERNLGNYDNFYNGSGVAIGDINNDGLQDIVFAGNDTPNRLYLNTGDLTFKDISKEAGIQSNRWSTGINLVDINKDGFLDIYVANSGPYGNDAALSNQLYINNGDLTFSEKAREYGIDDSSFSSHSVFFDMDKDGDEDLFVLNHSLFNYGNSPQKWEEEIRSRSESEFKKSVSTLYRNDNGRFTDITQEAGLYRPGFGLGVAVTDINDDGNLDIYVANDYYVPDFVYFGRGDGTFVEQSERSFNHTSFYSMGCDFADINNDGLVDLYVADMTPADHFRSKTLMESMNVELFQYLTYTMDFVPQYMFNSLSLNRGGGFYSEIAHMSGIAKTDWSWATLMMDLDNDTYKDLVITNGFKRDTKNQDWKRSLDARMEAEGQSMEVYFDHLQQADSKPIPNYVYRNDGKLKFENKIEEWGFEKPSFSNGAAYGDLDNDGDLDLVINNLESPAFIYRNNTSEKGVSNYLQVELVKNGKLDRVRHSKVRLFAGGEEQMVEYSFSRGYYSSMQPLAHFGLGNKQQVDRLVIEWPDGQVTTIQSPEINKRHVIDRDQVNTVALNKEGESVMFMDIVPQVPDFNYSHQENEYNDFAKEVLLPHKQSTQGPALAVGDINGDGLDDFYMGGAKDSPGALYAQSPQRGLVRSDQAVIEADAKHEHVGALFFDADQDGDLDLMISSGGGGDFSPNSPLLQDRLYMNDGQGNFSKAPGALPRMISSTGVIAPFDFDQDGDLDLFVGGRTVPGRYPEAPRSFLLENQGGRFVDSTSEIAPELSAIGMVTDVSWADVNQDGNVDLMLVGEWMQITVMEFNGSAFENKTELYGLDQTGGWWSSIEKGDFDKDGDLDFIVGNIGQNNKFHPSKVKPLHIFANDFDDNGTLDIVLSKDYQGSLVPVRGKECSTEQMPFLSEKFPTYAEFASSSLTQIYGSENLEAALHYQAETFSSLYLENNGDGTFSQTLLPIEAQMSPINDIVVHDFNRDGNLDLVLAGNRINTEPETTAYDAGKGLYLFGMGDGSFIVESNIKTSGLLIPGNCKGLALFELVGQRPAVLVANNNSTPQLFAWTR